MNAVFPIALAALALAARPAAAESVARFSNGDRLAGSLKSLSPERLVWKSPILEKTVPFLLKQVVDVSLPAILPEPTADHVATLTLTNGDQVRGQLASVSDQVIALDTPFAGRMRFNRLMVSDVKIEGHSDLLFRGPTGLEGWTHSNDEAPAWSYGSSAFRSGEAGGIAREALLPDECAVSFEVAWKGDAISLKVVLFSDELTSDDPVSGYVLSFQRGGINLQNGKMQTYIGSTYASALMEQDKVRVEIRASRKSGKICLLIDDSLIEVWTDPDVARGRFGSCLHFISQNALPMRISEIAVAPWNGLVEQMPEPQGGMRQRFRFQEMEDEDITPAPPEVPAENRMKLANGDSLQGEMTAIQDGLITVKTPLGDVKIPVGRLRTVALKKVDLEETIRRNGDIRGWFPDGSSVVFRLDAVGDGTLTGSSQNFGSATFKTAAFSRIEFNLYDVALEGKRTIEEW